MKNVADNLREILRTIGPLLDDISDEAASQRPGDGKWSKKEILGHLIDSACNNQQKFVRGMAGGDSVFPGYEQDLWVDSQKYNSADWHDLLALWKAYNMHLAHVIENVPFACLENSITIEGHGTFSLRFIMEDYVEHLKHHLNQILPDLEFSTSYQTVGV
jgi:hypothetical protein